MLAALPDCTDLCHFWQIMNQLGPSKDLMWGQRYAICVELKNTTVVFTESTRSDYYVWSQLEESSDLTGMGSHSKH